MHDVRRVSINTVPDIVAARAEGGKLAQEMGLDMIDQARIADVVIVSEYGLGTTVIVRRWLS